MSEPDRIDTTSLADALREAGDEETRPSGASLGPSLGAAKGQEDLKHSEGNTKAAMTKAAVADAAEEPSGYIIGDPEVNEHHSPETLSPVSARSLSPKPISKAATTAANQTPAATTAIPSSAPPRQAQRQIRHSESVHSLHAMFPDLDVDTVALVLETKGGNTEEAINALLQMNDPSFQAPAESNQVDSDAALAASIAAEQDRDIEYAQHQQRRGGSGRGGGGGGGFAGLGGLISQGGGFNPEPPVDQRNSYDPTKLTYQPRVRKTPASAAARAAYNAPPPSRAHDPSQSLIPGLPGPNEAKQWQEDLNRIAEGSSGTTAGMSKAASTFSALKAKAAASFGGDSSGSSTPTAGVYGEGRGSRDSSAGGSQRQSSSTSRERSSSNSGFGGLGSKWSIPSFGNNSGGGGGGGSGASSGGRNVSGSSTASSNPRGLMSPTGFDKDAATVGEDELAQILARGSIRPPPKDSPVAASGLASNVREKSDQDEDDGLLGWGGAAKTKKKLPSTSASAPVEKSLPTPASPTAPEVPTKSQNITPVAAAATGAVAGGAAVSGLVAGDRLAEDARPSTSTPAELHDDVDSDEEEYVSNPFADDD
ncbi:hypothetical protein OC861_006595 [Tilletia horrida]|nr:hypothetical protein OC861_006595 [Tilletia horrida]